MIDFKELFKTPDYDFLKTNPHLGDNIILLALGGSYAYGTNVDGSDIDIRGVAVNSPKEILLGTDFEQVCRPSVDTTVYSLKKFGHLAAACNPNILQILGLRGCDFAFISPLGQLLIDNKQLFLSQKVVDTFGGYATAQLRRLSNKAASTLSQAERQQQMLNSLTHAITAIKERHQSLKDGEFINLYVDTAVSSELQAELFIDMHLTHYPLRDWAGIYSELLAVLKAYKQGDNHRNTSAINHGKLGKHMMHLFRLYFMCIDLLERAELVTYREKQHDLLMDIRAGKFLDSDLQPTSAFYDLLNETQQRFNYAVQHTVLPYTANMDEIQQLMIMLNSKVLEKGRN